MVLICIKSKSVKVKISISRHEELCFLSQLLKKVRFLKTNRNFILNGFTYLDAYSWRDACWVASYPVAVDLYFGVPSSLAAEVDFAEEVVAAAVLVVAVVLVAVVG